MSDLIPTPIHYEINGKDWWIQEVKNSRGETILVNLIDEDGYFVGEYLTVDEAIRAVSNFS